MKLTDDQINELIEQESERSSKLRKNLQPEQNLLLDLFMDNNIMGGIATLSILCICLANSFRFSFRAFQIKHQKLCTVKEWFDRGNEWFPSFK